MISVRKMRLMGTAMAAIAFGVTSPCFYGCGGSGSGSGSNSDFGCSLKVVGQQYCYAYSKLASDSASSARSACSSQGGTVVNSCPTDGLVGCCSMAQSGMTFQSCYYFGTASTDEMACPGTWTDGSAALGGGGGGAGGGSGGGGGGGTTSSTSTTSVTTCSSSSNGLCCPQNYCTLGGAHGYYFAYSDQKDGGGSDAQISQDSRLCVNGNAVGTTCGPTDSACYSTHWGAGIGVNLNQASGTGTTPMSFSAASSAGVTYALDYLPENTRLVVGDSTTDYCTNLQSQSGTIPWRSFNSACWGTSGVSLSGPPANLVSVRFQVVADTAYGNNTSFTFCISQLSL
jgi:hypothetical protein